MAKKTKTFMVWYVNLQTPVQRKNNLWNKQKKLFNNLPSLSS